MVATEDRSSTGDSRRNGSAMCKPLLDVATLNMFHTNAFRVTGLPVDATMRQITKHADKLKMMEELGEGKSTQPSAFALASPPTVDQIREAIQRLKDPEQRIANEFFWFWPRHFGQSVCDPAIRALEAGDAHTALGIWTALETNPSDGVVAMHNVAVYSHLMALESETYYAKLNEYTEDKKRETEKKWRDAFKRWDLLAIDDLFWDKVAARVKQLDDPRLTTGFVRRMRATLPHALDKINAELAVRYAESGRADLAQVHVQFMRETNQGLDNFEETAELVLAPATVRLKQQIQRAQQRANKSITDALNAALELLDHARQAFALFDLFFAEKSEVRNELSDEVAALCNRLPVDYHKATGDNEACIDLLRLALPFATSTETQQQILENIATLTGNLTFKQLEPAYEILKAIQDSRELPSVRFERFRSEAVPALAKASTGMAGSEKHTELWDGAASVLRDLSLASWNDHKDLPTAVSAIDLALIYARSGDLRQRLIGDQTTLHEMASQRVAQKVEQETLSKRKRVAWTVALMIVGLVVLNSMFNVNQSSPRSAPSNPGSSSATEVTQSSSGVYDNQTYHVPKYMVSELTRERAAVEAVRQSLEELSARASNTSKEIEWHRRYLDQTDEVAVFSFNAKVREYNSFIEQVKEKELQLNQMAENYNAKLKRYSR
jgi:hypothetical protein